MSAYAEHHSGGTIFCSHAKKRSSLVTVRRVFPNGPTLRTVRHPDRFGRIPFRFRGLLRPFSRNILLSSAPPFCRHYSVFIRLIIIERLDMTVNKFVKTTGALYEPRSVIHPVIVSSGLSIPAHRPPVCQHPPLLSKQLSM